MTDGLTDGKKDVFFGRRNVTNMHLSCWCFATSTGQDAYNLVNKNFSKQSRWAWTYIKYGHFPAIPSSIFKNGTSSNMSHCVVPPLSHLVNLIACDWTRESKQQNSHISPVLAQDHLSLYTLRATHHKMSNIAGVYEAETVKLAGTKFLGLKIEITKCTNWNIFPSFCLFSDIFWVLSNSSMIKLDKHSRFSGVTD